MNNNNYLKNIDNMIKYNLWTLIKFEFIYKVLVGLIFIPLSILFFNLTMKITGYTYLTNENILKFISNPFTIILIFFIIIYLTVVNLFDISALIVIFDESYHKKKINVIDSSKIALEKCKSFFKIKNISVSFLILFLIPFLNIGVESNVISSITIPEYIMEYINESNFLFILYICIYMFLISIFSKWIFSLHYMVIENFDFKEARIKSKRLINNNYINLCLRIIFAQFLSIIIYFIFIALGTIIILIINKIFYNHYIIESFLITIIGIITGFSFIILTIISNGINYAVISSLFYKYKIQRNEKLISINYIENIKEKKKEKKLVLFYIIIFIIIIFCGSGLTYQIITGKTNFNIEYIRNIEITAHRGDYKNYPENTMIAFESAKKLGADWIELDVQQTKDEKIVVFHDSSLYRLTGIKKDIVDLDYEEIKKIDVGSYFNEKFKGERIPLLSEVIEFAKINNIRLNIELKPSGKEINFEKNVIDLIKKYNFQDRCVVTSQKYNVLKNIKKVDNNIKTVYVMLIAIGKITDLKYADVFSIEMSNITKKLVKKIHNEGKEVYVWTVNSEDNIKKMINMNIDNIITDNIELCKRTVLNSKKNNLLNLIMK